VESTDFAGAHLAQVPFGQVVGSRRKTNAAQIGTNNNNNNRLKANFVF